MKTKYLLIILVFFILQDIKAQVVTDELQDSSFHNVLNEKSPVLNIPVLELPQNSKIFPGMKQSLEISTSAYDIAYAGLDILSSRVLKNSENSVWKKTLKYIAGLGFAKYASELPIPLGVWGHEEFHRSVLAVNGIKAKNGNWVFGKWNGTVYNVSDEELSKLKSQNNSALLYAYTAGIQYEVAQNQLLSIRNTYTPQSYMKKALLLYNSYYVYDYFRFATGKGSDEVKHQSKNFENSNPLQRDFAGNDLTAWVYDMFNPEADYVTSRPASEIGTGVNRHIGISDLNNDAASFLRKQKKLSLLNFVNPAIFFVNQIHINDGFEFNFFAQYSPTHFGNDIALFIPFRLKYRNLLFNIHNYNSQNNHYYGAGVGVFNQKVLSKLELDALINLWQQPRDFKTVEKINGGNADITLRYRLSPHWSAYINGAAKTKGWTMANPYLDSKITLMLGVNLQNPF